MSFGIVKDQGSVGVGAWLKGELGPVPVTQWSNCRGNRRCCVHTRGKSHSTVISIRGMKKGPPRPQATRRFIFFFTLLFFFLLLMQTQRNMLWWVNRPYVSLNHCLLDLDVNLNLNRMLIVMIFKSLSNLPDLIAMAANAGRGGGRSIMIGDR